MNDLLPYSIHVGGRLTDLSEPLVMGILNVTPDSFYALSRRQTEHEIAQRARQIAEEGGAFIDVGAYSTRPGAQEVTEEEETRRLCMALRAVRSTVPDAVVSVDTFRARVAERIAEEFGPVIVNDVSGGADPDMFSTVAHLGLPYVLTHSPLGTLSTAAGTPTAQASPGQPLLPVVLRYFAERVDALLRLGQKDILLDPGFGFGKSLEENYQLLMQMDVLHTFGLPLLVGVSRKTMVWRLLGTSPEEALNGTTVLHTLALERGARILRVHDVAAATEVTKIMKKCSSLSV